MVMLQRLFFSFLCRSIHLQSIFLIELPNMNLPLRTTRELLLRLRDGQRRRLSYKTQAVLQVLATISRRRRISVLTDNSLYLISCESIICNFAKLQRRIDFKWDKCPIWRENQALTMIILFIHRISPILLTISSLVRCYIRYWD